jgi:hypothetical protein
MNDSATDIGPGTEPGEQQKSLLARGADENRLFAIINVVALGITLSVNFLATGLPLNGQTPSEIAKRFDSYFIPADFTFSIWGPIYLGLLAFVAYPFLPQQRGSQAMTGIGGLFAVSCIANAAWILLWHYEYFFVSPLLMLLMLGSVATIYIRLNIGRSQIDTRDWWLLQMPISLYLGWLTVATISNISIVLELSNWDGWGLSEEDWMLVMLAVTTMLAILVARLRRDVVFLLVLIWALTGIAVKHAIVREVFFGSVAASAVIGLLIVLIVLGWRRKAMIKEG